MSEAILLWRRGCSLNISAWSMNSFLDSETLREREREERELSPVKSPKFAKS
jgi:hypothetical protein